jgi:hypothetical protein
MNKTKKIKKLIGLFVLTIILINFSGCATLTLDKHKSYATGFTEWYVETASELHAMKESETEENKKFIEEEIVPPFLEVGNNVDAYMGLLEIWDAAKEKPEDIDNLFDKVQSGMIDVTNLIIKLRK